MQRGQNDRLISLPLVLTDLDVLILSKSLLTWAQSHVTFQQVPFVPLVPFGGLWSKNIVLSLLLIIKRLVISNDINCKGKGRLRKEGALFDSGFESFSHLAKFCVDTLCAVRTSCGSDRSILQLAWHVYV